jgi:TolB protein
MSRFLLFCLSVFFVTQAVPLRAELRIDVTQGQVAPTPIAVTDFYGDSPELATQGRDISQVVAADLERSGLFDALDSAGFIQDRESLKQGPRFGEWRVINAQLLVKGEITRMSDGRMRLNFRLYDVVTETQMEGLSFFTTEKNWRRIAHKIADAIYKRVTGEEGYFDTRIVYVAQTGPSTKRIKRLAIMDQDGENHRYLTDGKRLVLTPRFSPTLHDITYLDFERRKAQVYLMRLSTGQKYILGDFKNMTLAPRFSPDGRKIVMSYSKEGNTALFCMDLTSKAVQRLTSTSGPVIDTSPCYSPDGARIVFNSDRGGKTQIYVMDANGGAPERISFGEGSYRTPVWSPRGDLIAFTKMGTDGNFYIGVMKPDGSGERLLAKGWLVEDPSWAPNGRVILFTREETRGRSRLYSIDLTGRNEREVKTPTDASGGTWSPLIP